MKPCFLVLAVVASLATGGCSYWPSPDVGDVDFMDSVPVRPREKDRTAEYHLIVRWETDDDQASGSQDRVLGGEFTTGSTYKPFHEMDLQITVQEWNETNQEVSLLLAHGDEPPTELKLLNRERRILPLEKEGKKLSFAVIRQWRRKDGSIDFDFTDLH
jgi:hypothetical protein